MQRLNNLDYLRGICATGIMVYHYTMWTNGPQDADTTIGRTGIYGVSMFYVLSGLTLFWVYQEAMKPSFIDLRNFYIKRFFRIFPLLWLAIIGSLVLAKTMPDPWQFFLNITGLFGIFMWDGAYATGAWSIGNELVFYLFFPAFIFLTKRFIPGYYLLVAIIIALYFYFAFYVLQSDAGLEAQWKNYVNPLNQVFLFLGGYLIGYYLFNKKINPLLNMFILLAGMGLFLFYPADGNKIELVTGWTRMIFTLSCFLICLSFFKYEGEIYQPVGKFFSMLGEASYSIYLIHPLVYVVFKAGFGFMVKKRDQHFARDHEIQRDVGDDRFQLLLLPVF